MNKSQKQLIANMLDGKYLMKRMNAKGESKYVLYEGNQIPIAFVSSDVVKPALCLMKKNKLRQWSLNLLEIRKLDERSFPKKKYKALLKLKKAPAVTGAIINYKN